MPPIAERRNVKVQTRTCIAIFGNSGPLYLKNQEGAKDKQQNQDINAGGEDKAPGLDNQQKALIIKRERGLVG